MPDMVEKRLKAGDELFSTAVSRVKQLIEAIFNWLIDKVDFQRLSIIRSTIGLKIYSFGRFASIKFNSWFAL
jgi:diphthamide biosynthesis methyltransferase